MPCEAPCFVNLWPAVEYCKASKQNGLWKSKESLIVYARLNPESYGAWVLKAQTADITSINSTNLPQFDDDVCTSVLQQLADWEGLDD